jgi:hypothetical protein
MTIENISVDKLHTELNAAGIYPTLVYDNGDNTGDFTFTDDTDMTAVQTVIDAHNATEDDTVALTTEETIMLAIAELAELVTGGI